ncbi:uncharacterized protein HMPREF1541_02700 [Cyphellophora europaea CBS 101466]|uniref:VIT domain-containing protein n=1 Tax=Cyphellophora europaea (strain CBS 101466) TaxID=1220924 RepID=W2S4A9_CYPE1|nr:uncharacterized protein HMPREF1541_02700 [Cyphellophora europaea CBS 101466]ETN43541.1 hypothetical protein HMPREF1541_02700 [Cyphellophora europaea CBS 101466]
MPFCGCWFPIKNGYRVEKQYLPRIELKSYTKILSTTSRTELQQTFLNTTEGKLDEVQYTFPLYDGVSVVSFKCTIGKKTVVGVVKEKQQARADFKEAVDRGETAGLLEQIPEAGDVFTTTIGNVPANERIYVQIVYLGELKHDAETDGSRFTIPTIIGPRYGSASSETSKAINTVGADDSNGINISVDIELDKASIIRTLQSPSHPIAVTMGRTSIMEEDAFDNCRASATLALESAELGKDFVIVFVSKDQGTPQALLETHSTIPNQRAIMATLVPKFNIPNIVPEIVFVVDRSGSMNSDIPIVISALKIFLKSLPVNGIKFNICSFGTTYSFLFDRSRDYNQSSLDEALKHVGTFDANYGGTKILEPIKRTCEQRYKDMPLEVMLLTDGQINNQQALFDFINEQQNVRFFSLGIGSGASSSLVEGIARAGNGFAQFVDSNEKMDKRVVRMLKAALTPHVTDYRLSVQYSEEHDEGFEVIESSSTTTEKTVTAEPFEKKPISLFDPTAKEQDAPTKSHASRYEGVPAVSVPDTLQAPHTIPPLYPFNRTSVYLLLSQSTINSNPVSLTLRGTSPSGPLELNVPIQTLDTPGETIHQLAAKKAVQELEQGRGWLTTLKSDSGQSLKEQHEGRWDLIVERECVRLGTQFQVAGKYTSFVAVEKKAKGEEAEGDSQQEDFVQVMPERPRTNVDLHSGARYANMAFANARSAAAPRLQKASQASAGLFGGSSSSSNTTTGGGASLFGSSQPIYAAMASPPLPPPPAPAQSASSAFGSVQNFGAPPAAPLASQTSSLFGSMNSFASNSGKKKKRAARVGISGGSSSEGMMYADFAGAQAEEAKVSDPIDEEVSDPSDNEDEMHRLIGMQNFDGSWANTEALWRLLGIEESQVAAAQSSLADEVAATTAAVAWLEAKKQGDEEVWEMVVEKAKAWLLGKGVDEDVLGKVKALF